MAEETEVRPRSSELEELKLRTQIGGLLSACRVDPWIGKLWRATGSIKLLKELLEWEVQERPEIKRVLEKVIELDAKLVTSCTIVETKP